MTSITYFICIGLLTPILVQGGATVTDCGGDQASIIINGGSVKPDPVEYPGNLSMTVDMELTKDLAALQMDIKLTKPDLGDAFLPCINNFGSCSYDVCEMIESYRSVFCPLFPKIEECGCPMKAGPYFIKDALLVLPEMDLPQEIIQIVTSGLFEAKILVKDSDEELGCISTAFEMVPSS